MQSNIDNISDFGHTFQVKLIYSLLSDVKFLEQVIEPLNTKYFANESFAWCVDTIKAHYIKYKTPPSMEALAIAVKEIENAALRETVKSAIKDTFKDMTGLEFIKDKTVDFCKNEALKQAIYSSVDLFTAGKHLEVRKIIDEALKVGIDSDLGHDYLEMFEHRISETARKTVSTGWQIIDNIVDGGLGPGEMGIVVAPAGIGKSWGLVSMAASAMKNGLNVLYFTMELSQDYVGLRFDSHLTCIPSQNLKFHKEDVERRLSEITGTLHIKYYPTKSASVQTLRSYIEKMKMIKGFGPDIVFVDYADLLTGIGTEKRFVLENIYEDLRGVAGEFQIPLWTASQAHRAATEMDVIDGAQVSEAYSKIMIGDFIVSLSRKINDKVSGTARWHIIKNRMGKDGVTFPSKFNAATGQIEIYEEESMAGKETTHKMKDGNEVVRQLLKRKFDELEGTTEGFE